MTVISWDINKPHQCPRCHVDTVGDVSGWKVYTCCNCATRFARLPRLQRFLPHVGITCEECTEQHPVRLDGERFGFLHRRHTGIGMYAPDQFEAWLYDTAEVTDHRDGVRYLNTRPTPAEAMAEMAWRHLGLLDENPAAVLAVVAHEDFYRYGPDVTPEQQDGFLDGTLGVYGVGILRPYTAPHARRGQFYADTDTFTWGLIAPSGLEGLYTQAVPEPLAAHAPQL